MKTLKGPALFLAQFIGDTAPFDRLDTLAGWAAGLGYSGVQVPTSAPRLFDLAEAARSQAYCDDIAGMLAGYGLQITELSTHLQGSWSPSILPTTACSTDSPRRTCARNPPRQAWAVWSSRGGSGQPAWGWPRMPPSPAHWPGPISIRGRSARRAWWKKPSRTRRRWRPILDVFDTCGVELHPGEDLHDGATFERFLDVVDHHPRAKILYDPSHLLLQQMDYSVSSIATTRASASST